MPSKVQFFNNFQFVWNSAQENDWPKIRRNFVAAYISSYGERTLDELEQSAYHFPTNDSTSHPESFIGYCKSIRPCIY
jgi:hypothetical protein